LSDGQPAPIRQSQVDECEGGRTVSGSLQSFITSCGMFDLFEAQPPKRMADSVCEERVVVDDQDADNCLPSTGISITNVAPTLEFCRPSRAMTRSRPESSGTATRTVAERPPAAALIHGAHVVAAPVRSDHCGATADWRTRACSRAVVRASTFAVPPP
jgi:hypothetical protein